MAAMNGPQFLNRMIHLKGRKDFTCTLQDPRQWPALGEKPMESDQTKKRPFTFSASSPAFVSQNVVRRSSAISCSEASAENRTASQDPSSLERHGLEELLSAEKGLSTDHSHAAKSRTTSTTSQKEHLDSMSSSSYSPSQLPCSHEALHKTTSDEAAAGAARKKATKTKWIPLELPPSLSVQEKLRLRRRQAAGFRPEFVESRFRPPYMQGANNNGNNTAGWNANSNNHNSNASGFISNRNPAYPYSSTYCRRSFSGGQRPPRTLMKPKFTRKMQGFRNRDILMEKEFIGRDGDQQSDGTADDGSVTEGYGYGGQSNRSRYYGSYTEGRRGGEGSQQNQNDWTYYEGTADDSYGYIGTEEGAAEGYGYYAEGPEEMPQGMDYYLPVSEGYVASSEAELKEMIKYQVEYYFSPENLEKDFFLRRNMAQDGSVFLTLLASFNRVRCLSQDMHMILESIQDSERVELVGDGFMVRSRDHPELWPIEDEDARTTAYYFIEGENDGTDDYSYCAYYGMEDESGSGTGGEASGEYDEETDGSSQCEAVSMDGSDLSELSAELNRLKMKAAVDRQHHHSELGSTLHESFMQSVM